MTPITTLQQKFESDVGTFKTFVQTTRGLWLGKPAEREINVVIGSFDGKVTEVRAKFARAALAGPLTASPELDTIGVTFTTFMQASIVRIRELATATANATNSGDFADRPRVRSGIRTTEQVAETRIVDTTEDTTEDTTSRSFNPLWLLLAGAALGAVAIAVSRPKQ